MSKRELLSRRELLSAAGLGAAVWVWPRAAGAASFALPAAPDELLDVPGGAELAQAALERYRSVALFERSGPVGRASARIDLGAGMSLEIDSGASGARSIVVEAPGGTLELECCAARGIRRITAQLEGDSATRHPGGFDSIRPTDGGVQLTFSDDLALRYATPRTVAGARYPAVYDELAGRVLERAT